MKLITSRIAFMVLAALMAISTSSAAFGDITVSDGNGLKAALAAASGGDTILMAPGNYGNVYLTGYQFETAVTVRAQDRTNPPVIKFMKPNSLKNVTFDGLVFRKAETVPDNSYYSLVDFYPCENVTFLHCRFAGATITEGDQAGYGSGFGFKIRGCTNSTIRRCVFTNLSKCLSTNDENGITIEQNFAYEFRQDFIYIGGTNIVIEDNIAAETTPYTLPDGAGDHPDMVQCHGIAQSTIRNNFFRGDCQGIFGDGSPGYNTVSNNILQVNMRNALTLGGSANSMFEHNTILGTDSEFFAVLGVSSSSATTTAQYNISDRVDESSVDVNFLNNYTVQRDDPEAGDYYADIFVDALADSNASISDYALLAGAFGLPAVTPGADLSELFWLSVGDPSDPTNEMYPMWLQLDASGQAILLNLLDISSSNPGDIDGNGEVNIFDFLILKANYGTTSGATWEMGDLDGNEAVNIFDFLILKANYGTNY